MDIPETNPPDNRPSPEKPPKPKLPLGNFRILEAARKHGLAALLIAATIAVFSSYLFVLQKKSQSTGSRIKELVAANQNLKKEYEGLQKKYQDLENDRDNVLKQTKNLLAEKALWSEKGEELDRMREANKVLTEQKDKLHQETQKAKAELDKKSGLFNQLKRAYQEVQISQADLTRENDELRKSLTRKVESSPQYVKVDKENHSLKKENGDLKATIKTLDAKLKKALDRVQKLQARDVKFARQLSDYKKEIEALKAEREKLIKTNDALNKEIREAPDHMKYLAGDHQALVKETAQTHYNMGVFFMQNRSFDRAIKEFDRAIDLDPKDAKAHYNLGWIFSEELDQHEKALMHFKRFLELEPHAKEAEGIRAYMLTRQSYGDKITAKSR